MKLDKWQKMVWKEIFHYGYFESKLITKMINQFHGYDVEEILNETFMKLCLSGKISPETGTIIENRNFVLKSTRNAVLNQIDKENRRDKSLINGSLAGVEILQPFEMVEEEVESKIVYLEELTTEERQYCSYLEDGLSIRNILKLHGVPINRQQKIRKSLKKKMTLKEQ